jgi:hypothetical protein
MSDKELIEKMKSLGGNCYNAGVRIEQLQAQLDAVKTCQRYTLLTGAFVTDNPIGKWMKSEDVLLIAGEVTRLDEIKEAYNTYQDTAVHFGELICMVESLQAQVDRINLLCSQANYENNELAFSINMVKAAIKGEDDE